MFCPLLFVVACGVSGSRRGRRYSSTDVDGGQRNEYMMKLLNLQVKRGQSKWMMHASKRKAGFMFQCERYTRNNEANKKTIAVVDDGTNTIPSYLLLPEKRKRKDVLTEYDVNLITKACLVNSEESPN